MQFTSDPGTIMSINGSAFSAGATYEGITSVVSSGGAVPALAVFNSPALILALIGLIPVSYTHLDVYKRQTLSVLNGI